MKLRPIVLALPLVLGCSALFAATAPAQGGISFQQALDAVSKAGYKSIHKIEREHNFYEVEAFDAAGKEIKFKIDPMTGAITPMAEGHHAKKHHVKHHEKAKHHMKHHVKHHVKKHVEKEVKEAEAQPAS